jgi:putative oxidoreductase
MKAVTYILALIFALSGGAKLAGLEFEVQAFGRWGYPLWFMFAVGAAEFAGALALLVRRLSALAALALAALMLGALGTHVIHAEWGMLALASVILALCAWRAWRGRGDIAALVPASGALQA